MAKKQRKMARKAAKHGGLEEEDEKLEGGMDEDKKMAKKERRQHKKERKEQRKMARQERHHEGDEEKKGRRVEKKQAKMECCNLGRSIAQGLTADQELREECRKAAGETALTNRACKVAFKKCCLRSKGTETEPEIKNDLSATI